MTAVARRPILPRVSTGHRPTHRRDHRLCQCPVTQLFLPNPLLLALFSLGLSCPLQSRRRKGSISP